VTDLAVGPLLDSGPARLLHDGTPVGMAACWHRLLLAGVLRPQRLDTVETGGSPPVGRDPPELVTGVAIAVAAVRAGHELWTFDCDFERIRPALDHFQLYERSSPD
jgi:hypothetical protein